MDGKKHRRPTRMSDSRTLFWEFYRTLEDDSPLQDYLKFLVDTMGIEAAVLHLQESGYDI